MAFGRHTSVQVKGRDAILAQAHNGPWGRSRMDNLNMDIVHQGEVPMILLWYDIIWCIYMIYMIWSWCDMIWVDLHYSNIVYIDIEWFSAKHDTFAPFFRSSRYGLLWMLCAPRFCDLKRTSVNLPFGHTVDNQAATAEREIYPSI